MSGISLPHVSLSRSVPSGTDVLVVGIAPGATSDLLVGVPIDIEKSVAKRFGTSLLALAQSLGAKAAAGDTTLVPGPSDLRIVVVGLPSADVTPEQLRRAAGAGTRVAANVPSSRPLHVCVSLDAIDPAGIRGATEGALMGAYSFGPQSLRSSTPLNRLGLTSESAGSRLNQSVTAPILKITIVSDSVKAEAKDAVAVGAQIAEAVCIARTWVNLPANELYPETFAEDARARAKEVKIAVDVLDETDLRKQGFGGILAVGGGSSRPPRLVRYSYAPRGARFHLALVGKGITFDSGGLNLKPADGMYTMKCDMSGAAAILAATRGIAALGLKVKVTAYGCLAENLPSGSAYRPSDVLTVYGGKTVENANSDAEGRLVMADGLARASEDQPDLVVDVATLTGACMVALGVRTAGLMTSDDLTADRVLDAAETAGEPFWQLPITDEAAESLKSKVADLRSSGTKRFGGALTAAAFLREFVPEGHAWAHLDIAGPAFNEGEPYDYVPSGGTGFAVRTLIALASALAD